ncbi:MAG TPA: HEAT repeat domain-containing protein [Gemmatimonadales bacterium]|nr:HEAT repeat domain-containing protein [Gemmatimonadales bacterium]
MTPLDLLIIVAGIQGTFLLALVVLIVLLRLYWTRRRARVAGPRAELEDGVRQWLAGAAGPEPVLAHLRRLPADIALDLLIHYAARTPADAWRPLAAAVRRERWARRIIGRARSRFWWKRLEAARLLAVAGGAYDTRTLLDLLSDSHPAVILAAIGALDHVESPALATAVLERLPGLTPTVQAYAAASLVRVRDRLVAVLARYLSARGRRELAAYVDLAGRLGAAALRAPIIGLAAHPDPEVRTAVARALARYPHEETVAALERLARDKVWPVRAHAINSLGKIGAPTIPLFQAALRDASWWVRLRAALALARSGPAGRNALLAAEIGPDAFARDMARLVLGLPPGALAEYQR